MAGPLIPKYTLGVFLRDIAYQDQFGRTEAVQVVNLVGGGPAQQNGIEIGDIITRVNGNRIYDRADYAAELTNSGGTVTLKVKDRRTGGYSDRGPITADISNLAGGGGAGAGGGTGP